MSIKRLLFIPMMVLAGTDLFHDGVRLAVPLQGIVFAQALIQPFGLFPRWIAFKDEATVRKKPAREEWVSKTSLDSDCR